MAIISVFEAQNASRRSIMVDSTPVDHPNSAWDSGYRGPKFASSPVVPEDPTAPNFAHPDQIFPKFGALRAPNSFPDFGRPETRDFAAAAEKKDFGGGRGNRFVGRHANMWACAVSERRARSARRVGLSNRSETSVALSTHCCKSQTQSCFAARAALCGLVPAGQGAGVLMEC